MAYISCRYGFWELIIIRERVPVALHIVRVCNRSTGKTRSPFFCVPNAACRGKGLITADVIKLGYDYPWGYLNLF